MSRYNRFKQAIKTLEYKRYYDYLYPDAEHLAIRALRKEIPTLPQRKKYSIGKRTGAVLNCGRCRDVLRGHERYCPRCGQRILRQNRRTGSVNENKTCPPKR